MSTFLLRMFPDMPDAFFPEQSTVDISSILHWVSSCNRRHRADCPPPPKQDCEPHEIPQWLIDTQNGCIVAGSTAPRYVALRYVWPQGIRIMRDGEIELTTSNLSDLRKSGFVSELRPSRLPRVIRDAIDLARQLGESRLWVDRLCIVQDGNMKQAEIQHLDTIYSGAHFTIIAAASSGLYGRLASEAKAHRPKDLYDRLLQFKWATRGWTFQEQILSRRSVIFADGNVFWDCQHSLWSQGGPTPETEVITAGTDTVGESSFQLSTRVLPTTWPDFDSYVEFVCLYSDRDLTYPQDALPAFSGILSSLTGGFPGGFVGGLPQLFLDDALLWQPFSKGKRRIPVRRRGEEVHMTSAYLPSLSWCGWPVTVDPDSFQAGNAYRRWHPSWWRTQPLVQWSILSADTRQEEKLQESTMLRDYYNRFIEQEESNESHLPKGLVTPTRQRQDRDGRLLFHA
jgi:hypothetical protein